MTGPSGASWCAWSGLLALAFWLVASLAVAQPIETWLAHAAAAEARADPAAALASYRRALAADPHARLARRAERRIAWLVARSEGGFAPLTALMSIRAEPSPSLAQLSRFEASLDAFPDGLVRREGRAFCAQAYERAGERPAALAAYDRWLAEPALTEPERAHAQRGRALLLDALGGDGLVALEEAGFGGSSGARHLRIEAWLHAARSAAWLLGVAWVLACAAMRLWRGVDRAAVTEAITGERLALAAFVVGVPVLLVWRYDATLTRAAVAVAGVGLVGLYVGTTVGAAATRLGLSWRRRVLLAGLTAGTQLGLGVVALGATGLFAELYAAWF